MKELWVELGERRYPIYIGAGLLHQLAGLSLNLGLSPRSLVVSNPVVAGLYLERAERGLAGEGRSVNRALVPDGEAAKTLTVLSSLYDRALEAGMDRRSGVWALGGGVVGDVAGFLAATYMRGVPLIQLPTTLLAQVDSSVGGKVAVNHPLGKNLIGSFYQPSMVIADTSTLHTLPMREWSAGMAEVIKYGVIWDAAFFELLEQHAGQLRDLMTHGETASPRARETLEEVIWHCCRIKAEVVAQDERESGLRAVLNYGHTVGHALEAVTRYERYRHGEAIAIGMAAAGALAARLGLWTQADLDRMVSLLKAFELPVQLPPEYTPAELLEAAARDKKAVAGRLALIVPTAIGRVKVAQDIDQRELESVLKTGCR